MINTEEEKIRMIIDLLFRNNPMYVYLKDKPFEEIKELYDKR